MEFVDQLSEFGFPANVAAECAPDQAADYGHPVGLVNRPEMANYRILDGTLYRPIELMPFNCSSNKGLLKVLEDVTDLHVHAKHYVMYRVDINLYWRLIKFLARKCNQQYRQQNDHVCFFLSVWHSYKYLATEIWNTLCTGALARACATSRLALVAQRTD